ncbi:hypothetical protein LCGC14_2420890 [marine sediment metagenome]|uniref:Uncharacterized protein n=1 Tax=marine sediment metagenome TaxID=412755 RepID=A0A0F9BPQ3_9ZZZZ
MKVVRDYDPIVFASEFRSPDAMLKQFLRRSAATTKEAGRRAHFLAKPTHAARKRRGNLLERRRAAEGELDPFRARG